MRCVRAGKCVHKLCKWAQVCVTEHAPQHVCPLASSGLFLGLFSSCVNTLLNKLRALVNDPL